MVVPVAMIDDDSVDVNQDSAYILEKGRKKLLEGCLGTKDP